MGNAPPPLPTVAEERLWLVTREHSFACVSPLPLESDMMVTGNLIFE